MRNENLKNVPPYKYSVSRLEPLEDLIIFMKLEKVKNPLLSNY